MVKKSVKLSLDDLEIESFSTNLERVKGGTFYENNRGSHFFCESVNVTCNPCGADTDISACLCEPTPSKSDYVGCSCTEGGMSCGD